MAINILTIFKARAHLRMLEKQRRAGKEPWELGHVEGRQKGGRAGTETGKMQLLRLQEHLPGTGAQRRKHPREGSQL